MTDAERIKEIEAGPHGCLVTELRELLRDAIGRIKEVKAERDRLKADLVAAERQAWDAESLLRDHRFYGLEPEYQHRNLAETYWWKHLHMTRGMAILQTRYGLVQDKLSQAEEELARLQKKSNGEGGNRMATVVQTVSTCDKCGLCDVRARVAESTVPPVGWAVALISWRSDGSRRLEVTLCPLCAQVVEAALRRPTSMGPRQDDSYTVNGMSASANEVR